MIRGFEDDGLGLREVIWGGGKKKFHLTEIAFNDDPLLEEENNNTRERELKKASKVINAMDGMEKGGLLNTRKRTYSSERERDQGLPRSGTE